MLTLRWLFVGAISLFTLASIGCAFSGSFAMLISFRVLQGFAGGTLIPAVFSAVFLLFPIRLHPIATTMAGIMAVLAPTVGPVVGGWITETWSWHWLFLINVVPGIIAAAVTPLLLPRTKPCLADLVTLDGFSLALMAIALASLEIGLKQAPQHGWFSPGSALPCSCCVPSRRRALRSGRCKAAHPVVELSTLSTRSFAIGCVLSFCLGVGLFGSVYLMPVFLAYVRHHDAFEIGTIMLVTGVAQLVTAPIAGALESRFDPRWLSAGGFRAVRIRARLQRVSEPGRRFRRDVLAASPAWHRHHVLPAAADPAGARRIDGKPGARRQRPVQPDAKPRWRDRHRIDRHHPLRAHRRDTPSALRDRLIAGDVTAAQAIGLDLQLFTHRPAGVSDATVEAYVRPMVERAAFALSTNEAWALLTIVALLGLMLVPLARPPPERADANRG